MHALLTNELADERRRELLRQAERARRVAKARSARAAGASAGAGVWTMRSAVGRALVRLSVLVSGTRLDDTVMVVRRRHGHAAVVVIWKDRPVPTDPPAPVPVHAGTGDHSGSRR
jgi:hypothetical protein